MLVPNMLIGKKKSNVKLCEQKEKNSKYMGINNKYPFALKDMECLHRCSGYAKLTRVFLRLVGVYSSVRETENFNKICSVMRGFSLSQEFQKSPVGEIVLVLNLKKE